MFFKKTKEYFTVEETAAFLGKSIGQIDLYIWLNKIANIKKIGAKNLIPCEEVYRLQDQDVEKGTKIKPIIDSDYYDNESLNYL